MIDQIIQELLSTIRSAGHEIELDDNLPSQYQELMQVVGTIVGISETDDSSLDTKEKVLQFEVGITSKGQTQAELMQKALDIDLAVPDYLVVQGANVLVDRDAQLNDVDIETDSTVRTATVNLNLYFRVNRNTHTLA